MYEGKYCLVIIHLSYFLLAIAKLKKGKQKLLDLWAEISTSEIYIWLQGQSFIPLVLFPLKVLQEFCGLPLPCWCFVINGAQALVMGNLSNVKLITCNLTASGKLSMYFMLSWYSSYSTLALAWGIVYVFVRVCIGWNVEPAGDRRW